MINCNENNLDLDVHIEQNKHNMACLGKARSPCNNIRS